LNTKGTHNPDKPKIPTEKGAESSSNSNYKHKNNKEQHK
jgi:hypothetical protein